MFSLVLCTLDSLWGDSWAFNETIQGLTGPKAHCWWFQINDCLTGSPAVWRHVPVSWGEPSLLTCCSPAIWRHAPGRWRNEIIQSLFWRVVDGGKENEMITLSITPVNIFAFFWFLGNVKSAKLIYTRLMKAHAIQPTSAITCKPSANLNTS